MRVDIVDQLENAFVDGWGYAHVQGMLMWWIEQFLLEKVTRDEFTAMFAQVQMVWERYSQSIGLDADRKRAMHAAIAAVRATTVQADSPPVVDGEASA